MTIIDVDSHWEPPKGGPGDFAGGRGRIEALVGQLAGDLLRNVPPERKPPSALLAGPELAAFFGQPGASPMSQGLGADDVPGRLAWMKREQIDYQLVNGGGFTGLELSISDPLERRAAVEAANNILLDDLGSRQDKFGAVAICDPSDLGLAIAELTRCRERGARAFHVRAEPPGGISYAHPCFDRLWSAAVDLGMVAYLHIGNTPAYFDAGWAEIGLEDAGWTDDSARSALLRLSNSARTQSAETMISAMVYGGVFARHPKLTLLVAELWAGWVPFLAMRLEQNTHMHRKAQTDLFLGRWPYPMSGGEYFRHHVRVSPLPGLGPDGIPTLLAEPEMTVFSSDYPHLEGSSHPLAAYGTALDHLDPSIRKGFLCDNIAKAFSRMGDPLPVTSSTLGHVR